jgi:hypothetical protein
MFEHIDLIAVIISLVSLGVSVYVERRAARLNESAFRRTAEHDHIAALLELDRVLISNPELWAIYDDHPLARQPRTRGGRLAAARREAFIFSHLNIFELVHDFYHGSIHLRACDRRYWAAWDRYIRQFFRTCSEARTIFRQPRAHEIYAETFTGYAREIIRSVEGEEGVRAAPSAGRHAVGA